MSLKHQQLKSKGGGKMKKTLSFALLVCLLFTYGCASAPFCNSGKLQTEIDSLKSELQTCQKERDKQVSNLEDAKRSLEESLKKEIAEQRAKLEMTERGLVVTFMAEVFFDSGKATIREEATPILKDVAEVLSTDVSENLVAIEGHTDNVPIKYSGWKSNWELANARALAVLHYFVDECQIEPIRLSAVSFGEYNPVADNETPEGRQKNRRVEVVILPPLVKDTAD